MQNFPGPSFSRLEVTENNKKLHLEKTENTGQKKKRIRRRARNKVNKEQPGNEEVVNSFRKLNLNEQATSTSTAFDFVIKAVVQPQCTFYKQRDQLLGHINLHSYVKDKVCSVFQTCDFKGTLCSLERFTKLSLPNGICLSPTVLTGKIDSSKSKSDKGTSCRNEKKKKDKKKEPIYFPEYISQEEIKTGVECGELIKGFIRINPKNFKEAYVGHIDMSKSDYLISSVLHRNRALDGDEVLLRLKAVDDDKKLMEVVYITQKIHPRTAVGFLEPIEKNKEFALFIPRDKRIPKMKISKINWPSGFQSDSKLYSDILFIAKITDWKEVKYAYGTIIENLGLNGDLKVESLAILREFCLDPTPYDDDIKEFLPKSSEISNTEFEYREDLRKMCIFTIDPLTARDLDDAVSCTELPNGNFEIGVHISDASFFLKENTKLDELVKNKATTIYLVETVYHMLPIELCCQCSLLPGLDKLAFSVFWEMNSDGEVLNKRISRTIINSCAQLAYEHVQMMIEDPNKLFNEDELPIIHNDFTPRHLIETVNVLQRIAVRLREKRKQNGSLKIDQVKISFALDPLTGQPQDFWIYENKAAHRLIEEFMLLANMTVAEKIYEAFPDLAFLRLHEAPKPSMMYELQTNLETVGIHLDISSSAGIQSSLDKYVDDDFLGRSRMVVLNHLLAKPMKRARYFCAGAVEEDTSFRHFALSIPIYTHFTSPIRRYADIMTHRLLAASLNYREKPNWSPTQVADIAEICNRQKYLAKRAGEASSDLYLAHYVEAHQPCLQEAIVVDTKERSIDVIILNTGSVVRIYTNNFGKNVSWKSEEIKVQRNHNISKDVNVKKMWKIFVHFPKTNSEDESFLVLEMFTLVTVELYRKPKTNKLEAKLCRPTQQQSII